MPNRCYCKFQCQLNVSECCWSFAEIQFHLHLACRTLVEIETTGQIDSSCAGAVRNLTVRRHDSALSGVVWIHPAVMTLLGVANEEMVELTSEWTSTNAWAMATRDVREEEILIHPVVLKGAEFGVHKTQPRTQTHPTKTHPKRRHLTTGSFCTTKWP